MGNGSFLHSQQAGSTGAFTPGSSRVSGLRHSSWYNHTQSERDLSRSSIFGSVAAWAQGHRSSHLRNSSSSLEELQEGREGDVEEGGVAAQGGGSTESSSQQHAAAPEAVVAKRRPRR